MKSTLIPPQLKAVLQNRTKEEIASDQLYSKYPQLFSAAFSNIKEQEIKTLNTAGFLYYKSVLLLDELIDKKVENSKAETLFLSNKLQEESIKLLTSVFGLNNSFWNLWSKRQQEYFKAVQLEKQLALNPSYQKYQEVANLKAAFGKVAIDCLHILSKEQNKEKYDDLLQSHHHFSIGLQLIDDLQDLEEDVKNEQFNWAYFQTISTLKKEAYKIEQLDISDIKKLMYIKSIANDIRKDALIHLKKSKQLAKKYNPTNWLNVIENQEKEVIQAIDKINSYNYQIYARLKFSSELIKVKFNIEKQLSLAKNFIVKQQNADGSWFDYNTNAGMSNVWSTAFILNNIFNVGLEGFITKKAVSFLINNSQDILWGYNTSMLPDNDSTSFVLLALSKTKEDISKKLKTYIAQQKFSGGYSTYSDEKSLSNYLQLPTKEIQGWLQEHVCVSAVSYYLMETLNLNDISKDKLFSFLLKNQHQNGLWNSYWWTSPIYATSFVIPAYFINHTEPSEQIKKAIDGLLLLQQNDGSFIDNHKAKSPFYTALVVIALSSNKSIFIKHQNKIKLAIQWLLTQQTTDGSFLSTYSLQLPDASVVNTEKIKNWSKKETQATNIITNDFMRLFTTSTCVKALNLYSKNGGK